MLHSATSPFSSPSSTSVAARARNLLAPTNTGTNIRSPGLHPLFLSDKVPLPSSTAALFPADFDHMNSSKQSQFAESSAVAPLTPSQRARALLARQDGEPGDPDPASALPRVFGPAQTNGRRSLFVQMPVSPADHSALNSGVSAETKQVPRRGSISSGGGETTAALVRCLQLSKSSDLWFGPQLQLALEGARPSSSTDFLLLPWIISNCSRRVSTVVATATAARARALPLDNHTMEVLRSLVQMCSGDGKQWQQHLDSAAAALGPFVSATSAEPLFLHNDRQLQSYQHVSVETNLHISSASLSLIGVTHAVRGYARDLSIYPIFSIISRASDFSAQRRRWGLEEDADLSFGSNNEITSSSITAAFHSLGFSDALVASVFDVVACCAHIMRRENEGHWHAENRSHVKRLLGLQVDVIDRLSSEQGQNTFSRVLYSFLMLRISQHMNVAASAALESAAAASLASATVTFVNVMKPEHKGDGSENEDALYHDAYNDIIRAFAASAAARRAAYARECNASSSGNFSTSHHMPIAPVISSSVNSFDTLYDLLSSAQALVLRPPHVASSLSLSSHPPSPSPLSVVADQRISSSPSPNPCVHIRFIVSSASVQSMTHRLEQTDFPSLFHHACPEVDVSYSAFNFVMQPCVSAISADLAAAARLHLALTNRERCVWMLKRLLDACANDGDTADGNDEADGGIAPIDMIGDGVVAQPLPHTGTSSLIALNGQNMTQATVCLWFHDTSAAVAVFSQRTVFMKRAAATFVSLLQRYMQQRTYMMWLLQQDAARTITAAASRRYRQLVYRRNLDVLQRDAAMASSIIARRVHSQVFRRSFSSQSSQLAESAIAAVATVSAYVIRFFKRSKWSGFVSGVKALNRLTTRRRCSRKQIAIAAAETGCSGRIKGDQSEIWITVTGSVLRVFASEISVVARREMILGQDVQVKAWGGGWKLSAEGDNDGDENGSLFSIQISSHRTPASSITLTFPHPLSLAASSSGSPAACLVLLKKIFFACIYVSMPPPPFPFAFRSCSKYCHAIREVNSMIAAANVAVSSAPDCASKVLHVKISPKINVGSDGSSLIARIAAAHCLSQAASRTVLSLKRIAIMQQLLALLCRLRAAPVHRRWHRFVTIIKRSVMMTGVLRVVNGNVSPFSRNTFASSPLQHLVTDDNSVISLSFISMLNAISHPSPSIQSSYAWKCLQQPSSFRNPAFSLYHATICRLRYANAHAHSSHLSQTLFCVFLQLHRYLSVKEALHTISACAARYRAVSQMQRWKEAKTVICGGWKRLLAKLQHVAAEAFVHVGCLMLDDLGGREEWLRGQLTINSFKHTMDFVHDSSSADERLGPKRIFLSNAPHIGFKCVSATLVDNGGGRGFDVHVDLFHSKVVFRFQCFQDALDIHICLLGYLLFRGMMSHHSALPPNYAASQRAPASTGSHYAKMRAKLLRSLNVFLAYKSTVRPPFAASTSSFAPASVGGSGAFEITGKSFSHRRKAQNHAVQLVGLSFSILLVTRLTLHISDGTASRFMGVSQRAPEFSKHVRL
jgi:hypothetical protein